MKKIFLKIFLFLGYEPPYKLPKKNNLELFVSQSSESFRRRSLKNLALKIKLDNDHVYYDLLLREFIPDLDLQMRDKCFIGDGMGMENLNCYRKILLTSNDCLFEKVYFSDNDKLKSLLWFEKNIIKIIDRELVIPTVKKSYFGEVVTAVYFKFLKLKLIDIEDLESKLNKIAVALYSLSNEMKLGGINPPEFFLDYKKHNYYIRNVVSAKIRFDDDLKFESISSKVDGSYRVLTHGDLSETNVFDDNTVIDWDSCGYFPLGLDFSKIYFRLIVNERNIPRPAEWLKREFKHEVKIEHWEEFLRNFLFFLLIFIQEIRTNKSHNLIPLEEEIITILKG